MSSVASQSSPLSPKDLQRVFQKLDRNGDGLVSLDELNWLLERIGVETSAEELETLVAKPSLSFEEFLFFYENNISKRQSNDSDEHVDAEESDLAKAFGVFDLNGDGFISCEELQSVLERLGMWDEGKDCRNMICVYDTNLDGMLDFEEFKSMMFNNSTTTTTGF